MILESAILDVKHGMGEVEYFQLANTKAEKAAYPHLIFTGWWYKLPAIFCLL
jgi:hypothetical protein